MPIYGFPRLIFSTIIIRLSYRRAGHHHRAPFYCPLLICPARHVRSISSRRKRFALVSLLSRGQSKAERVTERRTRRTAFHVFHAQNCSGSYFLSRAMCKAFVLASCEALQILYMIVFNSSNLIILCSLILFLPAVAKRHQNLAQ